jgi:pyrroline-5-carboxylate reductase
MQITIIGNGNMAKAIINGLSKHNFDILVIGRDEIKLKNLQKQNPNIDIAILTNNFDISNHNIIFCVKPINLEEVGAKLKGKADNFYSVLAGTTISSLKQNISSKNYIRVMPNVSAKFCKSMTTLTGDKTAQSQAIKIFSCIGKTLWVDTQKELDIATAVAGSGPAFLAFVANSFIQKASNLGLKPQDALSLTQGLFDGFAPLLHDDTPKNIVKKIMSPNGTTQAGYEYMTKNNLDKLLGDTIDEAYKRALQLAKK